MLENIEKVKPEEIEKRSFEIISEILGDRKFEPLYEPIIKRVIHTTADFEFAELMSFSEKSVETAMEVIKGGCKIVTDTRMAWSGINKSAIEKLGGNVECYMDNAEVIKMAKEQGVTRASLCMEYAAKNNTDIYVIGNAPTALIRLYELIKEGVAKPKLIIGVPVGFVNVVESKELIKQAGVPYIIVEGRKGGSNIAAAIVNAILYKTIEK